VSGHCKDCRFWIQFDKIREPRPDGRRLKVGYSDAAQERKLGLCALASFESDKAPDPMVLCEDASDYVANLRTSGEFGCVRFEAKS
jgi:hypothetical protein